MGPRTQHLRCFLALEKKEKRFIIAVTFRRSRLLTAVCLCKIWIPAFNTTASMMSPSNHAHQVMHEERSCRTGGRARDTLFPWQTFRMPDLSFGMIIGQTAPNPTWPMRKRKPAPHDELEMPPTAELPEPVVAVHDKLKGLSLHLAVRILKRCSIENELTTGKKSFGVLTCFRVATYRRLPIANRGIYTSHVSSRISQIH